MRLAPAATKITENLMRMIAPSAVRFASRLSSCGFLTIAVLCGSMMLSSSALAQAKQQIRIGGAGAGGLFYIMAGGMATVLNKYSTMLSATVQATSGGVENSRLVEAGQIDMALVTEDVADHAWRGVDEFKQPATNLRLLIKGHPTLYTFVTLAKSDIRTLQDIKGKIVTFGPPGAGGTVLGERILAEAGLKSGADYRAQVMAYGQQNDALRDGRIDVAFNGGQIPIPQLVELNSTTAIRLLPIPPAVVESVQRKYGKFFIPQPVPANAFKGQSGDVPAINIGFANVVVRAGLPDAVVREIAKVLSEHNADLIAVHGMGTYYQAKEAFNGNASYMPFHPGAIAYLKEISKWDSRPPGIMEAVK